MSKTFATAAMIVGGIALAATGVGALADAAFAAGVAGTATLSGAAMVAAAEISVTAATVASIAEIAAAGLAAASALTAKSPKASVSPMAWSADPNSGIPYSMGRCYVGGQILYRMAYGDSNKYESLVTTYSGAGPAKSIDQLYVDGVATSIGGGGIVSIDDRGKMYCATQLGRTPEPASLSVAPVTPYQWTSACKLSGHAASIITFIYDSKGGHTFQTTPQTGFVGHWVAVYDPRKDSTYPGGSGSHRSNDETTWEWSDNPALHGLTWLIGRRQNGKLMMGVGCPVSGIIMSQLVEWANICQTNGWKLGGSVLSTDDKWDVFKQICQAGGAEPLRLGAQIGVLVNTPRVSLATITVGDIVGDSSVQATQARRDRINAVVPRCMTEQAVTAQDSNGNLKTSVTWSMLPIAPVVVQDYVTFDGRQRQREVSYPLVQCWSGQTPTQAVQLARYEIENAREFGPIVLPLKLRWMGYKPGDVVTVQSPEHGLNGQDILLMQRTLSPQNGTVTMTARTETADKHAFALGQTSVAPATPSVSGPLLVPTPAAGAWAITGTGLSQGGTSTPALIVTGVSDSSVINDVLFEYRVYTGAGMDPAAGWQAAGKEAPSVTTKVISGLQDATAYQVAVSYRLGASIGGRLILGPVTTGATYVNAVTPTNRVRFSRFERGTVGWLKRSDTSHIAGAITTGTSGGKPYLALSSVPTAAGQLIAIGTNTGYEVAVTPGERLCAVAGLGATGPCAQMQLLLRFRNAAGTQISTATVATVTGAPAYDTRTGNFTTVPAGAVTAVLEVDATSSGAGSSSNPMAITLDDPMIAQVSPTQTTLPSFVAGPNSDDGATVGAPSGTPVGSSTADAVVTAVANAQTSINNLIATVGSQPAGSATLVQQLASLGTSLNGLSAAVTVNAGAITTLQGRTGAYFDVTAVDSAGDKAELTIFADNGSGGKHAGVVITGDVDIDGDLLVTGSIGTAKLAQDSVNLTNTAEVASDIAGNGAEVQAISFPLTLPSAAKVTIIVSGQQSATAGVRAWSTRLLADGTQIGRPTGGTGSFSDTFSFTRSVTLAAGNHTITLDWTGADNTIKLLAGSSITILSALR